MKLTRVILAAAVIAFAACTKNQDIPETSGDNASQMTIKAVNPGFTKTTTTDGATVLWENGDEIAVFVSGGYVDGVNTNKSAIFKTSVSTPASSATFHCTNGEIPVTQPDEIDENKDKYLAVFPASALWTWNSSPKMRCSMDIPAEQKVSAPGWDKRASLMAATSTTKEFVFHHCVSYVKFTVTEGSPEIVSFNISADEPVVARVNVQMAGGDVKADMTTPTTLQKNTVTLSMEDGTPFPVGTYYVAILSKTYANGLTLSCTDVDGKTFGKKKTPANTVMSLGAVGNYGQVKYEVYGTGIDPLETFDIFNMPIRVSIVGDSISTYEGYIPSVFTELNGGETAAYYPAKGTLTSVDETYWHQIIYKKMDNAILEMNNSWRGTMVTRRIENNYIGCDYSARVAEYGLGNPDVIFIHGGTNDSSKHSDTYVNRPGTYRADMLLSDEFLAQYDATEGNISENEAYWNEPYRGMAPTNLPTQDEFNEVFEAAEAADTWAEIVALEDRSFIHGYVKLLNMIHFKHPHAKVVMIIGDELTKRAQTAILDYIAPRYEQKYGYKCVNFWPLADSVTPTNNAHPDYNGHTFMADTIFDQVGSYINVR